MKNTFIDELDYTFTDYELDLLFSCTIGTVFMQTSIIPISDHILDYRLKIMAYIEELGDSEDDEYARAVYEDEIKCTDLILSVRTYYMEYHPDSRFLEKQKPI